MLLVSLWVFRGIREVRVIGGFALFFFLLSIFLMLKISLSLWESLPFLNLIQFPLRFSAISIFCASIAAGLLIKYLPFKRLLSFSLVLLVLFANRNHWNINQVFDPGEDYYLKLQTTSTTYGEHLPKWGRVMSKKASSKLEFVKGGGNIKVVEDKSNKVLAEIEVTPLSKLRLNQFYFPGWEVKVDGKIIDFNYLTDGESYGLPVFDIDSGVHQIKAEFKNTLDRNIGDWLSVITVIILIYLWSRLRRS